MGGTSAEFSLQHFPMSDPLVLVAIIAPEHERIDAICNHHQVSTHIPSDHSDSDSGNLLGLSMTLSEVL